jgi:toxin HigB-1
VVLPRMHARYQQRIHGSIVALPWRSFYTSHTTISCSSVGGISLTSACVRVGSSASRAQVARFRSAARPWHRQGCRADRRLEQARDRRRSAGSGWLRQRGLGRAGGPAERVALITRCVIKRCVLRSLRDKDTEAVWHRRRSRKFDASLQRAAWRKLAMLDAAEILADLRISPGNRPEKLAGDRAGQYGVRVSQQWRIWLRWTGTGPQDVEIADYL